MTKLLSLLGMLVEWSSLVFLVVGFRLLLQTVCL